MKASEWNNPKDAPHSVDLWIAVRLNREETKIVLSYKSYITGEWREYDYDLIIESERVLGWLPIEPPTWEPDDE